MSNLKPISESSILADREHLTDEQFNDMLAEFNKKAKSIHELFSCLNSRISSNDLAGSTLRTTNSQPALTIDDEVQIFKKRELERLHLDYIIPILNEEVNY